METISPIGIIGGPTRRVLIWDGEVTEANTTRATTGIGETTVTTITATTITSKAIMTTTGTATAITVTEETIRGINGAATRNAIGADEMSVRPGDGHHGITVEIPTGRMKKNQGLRSSPQALLAF